MIINYGAFVSPTLDKNYLPLILKYLELYTLTYGLDDILGELSKNTNKTFVKAGSSDRRLRLENENENEIIEIDNFEILDENLLEATDTRNNNKNVSNRNIAGNKSQKSGSSVSVNTSPSQSRPISGNTSTSSEKKPLPKTDTGQLDRSIISVEPTWIKVTYGENVFIFGVKVLPVYIKDDTALLKELINDSKNSIIKILTKGIIRSMKRIGYKIYNKTIGKIPLLGRNPPQGVKVKNQIIYATSSMKNNVYLVLNKNNIDPSFLEDTKSLSDMQKYLNWCSMIFVDDVNQQASFCMRVNHGMCNIVPYRVLMQSASKTLTGAYNDIDDIQNAVQSVFKMKKQKMTKLLGEMKIASSLLDVQQYLSEIVLQENTSKYLSNPNLAIDMFKKVRFIAKNSDIDIIRKKMATYPAESVSSIMPFIKKNSKNFDKLYKFTSKVFKNSLEGVTDKDIEIASIILAYRNSNMRGINQFTRLRQAIKEYIITFRKNVRQINNPKIALFRTTIDIFNSNTSILKYNDLGNDKERQEIILRNMYVFLSLIPLLILENEGE